MGNQSRYPKQSHLNTVLDIQTFNISAVCVCVSVCVCVCVSVCMCVGVRESTCHSRISLPFYRWSCLEQRIMSRHQSKATDIIVIRILLARARMSGLHKNVKGPLSGSLSALVHFMTWQTPFLKSLVGVQVLEWRITLHLYDSMLCDVTMHVQVWGNDYTPYLLIQRKVNLRVLGEKC